MLTVVSVEAESTRTFVAVLHIDASSAVQTQMCAAILRDDVTRVTRQPSDTLTLVRTNGVYARFATQHTAVEDVSGAFVDVNGALFASELRRALTGVIV